jgi:nitroreductase
VTPPADDVGLYDGIMTTRALRRFTDEPVTTAEVESLLRAAQQGPSGGNIQPWQFLVVVDPAERAWLGELYRRAYRRYEAALVASLPPFRSDEDRAAWERTAASASHLADHLGAAPVVVLVCMPDISMALVDDEGELDVGTPYASVYPAVQNLLLAARSMGIGGVLTTVHRIHHDELRDHFGVPSTHQVVALVPLGRPRGRFGVAPRRPVERVTHWDRWGERREFTTPPYEPPAGSGRGAS